MCGRFTLVRSAAEIMREFGLDELFEQAPRYNIAPTQQILTVRRAESRHVGVNCRWGLIPSWSPTLAGAAPLINARAESVAEKPAFRSAFAKRRCLVPADGFYEWKTEGRKKYPHLFSPRNGKLLSLAGVWEVWERGGERIESVCLLTTTANEVVRMAHDRMPVILPASAREVWLDPATEIPRLQALLCPYPADAILSRAVSPALNSARIEGPECQEGPGPMQRVLF